MIKFKLLAVLFIAIIASGFYALNFTLIQSNSNELLPWSQDKLTWDLFRSKKAPNGFHSYHAVTVTVQKNENYYFDNDSISFDVTSYLDMSKSWKSEIIISNIDLLNHEQRHFDLNEIYARKLRKALSGQKFPEKPIEFKWKIDKLSFKYDYDFLEMSKSYDEETRHGTIKHIQDKWDRMIDSLLLDLNDYSNTKVVILKSLD
jgi:hypothetical protein